MAGLVVGTTLGALFVVLIAGGSGSLESVGVRLVYDTVAALALVPWLAVATFRPGWLPSSRLWPAVVACLAAFAISTITSRAPRLSLEMLSYAVLLAELYLLLVVLMRRPRLRAHFARLALGLCVIVCVLYLLQVFQAWSEWWGLVGRLALPPLRPDYLGLSLGSPNPVATLALLLSAFVLGAARLRTRTERALGAMLVALVGVTTLITGSRGAWLGAAAALVVTGIVAFVWFPEARSRAAAVLRSRWAIAAAVALVVVAGGALVIAALSGRLTFGDAGLREALAAVSLRMFQGSPITGFGPGTWQVFRAGNTIAGQIDYYIPHAHSIYWQTLAEFGLLGALAGLVVAFLLGQLLFRALRSKDHSRRRMALAALFGVVLLAVQQVADMLMNVPALLLALALPLAWLDATAPMNGIVGQWATWPRLAVISPFRRRAVPLAMMAVTCVIAVGLFRMEDVAGIDMQAVSAANAGNWADATALAQQAANADPALEIYQFTLGVAAANVGDLPIAETALGKSATADDYTYAWLDLAAVRWQLGDAAGARDALARAERLGLQRATVALSAGWLRQQLGDREAAIADYVAALGGAPTLARDPFWSSSPGLRDIWPSVWTSVQAAVSGPTLLELDLVAGQEREAAQVAATLAQRDPGLYSLVVPAWEGDATAWATLQTLAAARPLDPDPAGWCELVAAHRGNQTAGAKYGRWLAIANFPDSGLPQVARVASGHASALPPLILDRYGSLFRRPVPDAQIVGILPQLVWQDHF